MEDAFHNLLVRNGSSDLKKLQILIRALVAAGIQDESHLLMETHSVPAKARLQRKLREEAKKEECNIPDFFTRSLRMATQAGRLQLSKCHGALGSNEGSPIVFTAPHSIYLRRDGHKPHMPETLTSRLARDIAEDIQCTSLTWCAQEEKRSRRWYKAHGKPDASNQDPNFTNAKEVQDNMWARTLAMARWCFGDKREVLHVDLHGCKDPGPDGGAHLVVGMGAMELQGNPDLEDMRTVLHRTLSLALEGFSVNMRPKKSLTGVCSEEGRWTLSQQSLSKWGGLYSHSLQIEMSKRLRQTLASSRELRKVFGNAIVISWLLGMAHRAETEYWWEWWPPLVEGWIAECQQIRELGLSACVEDKAAERMTGDGEEEGAQEGPDAADTANVEPPTPPCAATRQELESYIRGKAHEMYSRWSTDKPPNPDLPNLCGTRRKETRPQTAPVPPEIQELQAWLKTRLGEEQSEGTLSQRVVTWLRRKN